MISKRFFHTLPQTLCASFAHASQVAGQSVLFMGQSLFSADSLQPVNQTLSTQGASNPMNAYTDTTQTANTTANAACVAQAEVVCEAVCEVVEVALPLEQGSEPCEAAHLVAEPQAELGQLGLHITLLPCLDLDMDQPGGPEPGGGS